jgi:hypothetical protein
VAQSIGLVLAALCGCTAYDPDMLDAPERPDAAASLDGGSIKDAPDGAAGASAGRGGGGSHGNAGKGGGGDEPDEPDLPIDETCRPNPDAGKGDCAEICPERCNGKDDDCDGKTDEETPRALCKLDQASGVCSEGACVIVECKGSYRDCDHDPDNGCETAKDDVNNCGACGHACKIKRGSAACVDGECTVDACEDGWDDCDDDHTACELETNTLADCGACGEVCKDVPNASPSCETGECGVDACKPGFGDCDHDGKNGCEEPLDSLAHCGACDTPCALASCGGGVCTLVDCTTTPGFADCDGDGATCEVDLRSDVDNCVACNAKCEFDANVTAHGDVACSAAGCKADCDAGWGDCDGNYKNGCETPLDTIANCGTCGLNCDNTLAHTASTTCEAGSLTCRVATCDAGFANCDGAHANGCEIDLHTVENCGGCANLGQNQVCEGRPNANTACASGTCTIASCKTNWANCDGNVQNGCERDARPPASGGLGPCLPDDGCVKSTNVDHEYYVCPTARTWSDARSKCQQQLRGDLLQIADANEKTFIQPKVTANSWIGGTDQTNEGVWVWASTGMAFWQGSASGAPLFSQYTAWAGGEPNVSGNCTQLYTSGTYDDTDCAATKPFVCEVSPDGCASDPNKIDPGQCGCGNPDTDADGDSFAICNDACPSDKGKRAAGVCGCGVADTDSDNDGTPNCHDACPNNGPKTAPGVCGCAVADTDGDGDTVPNCNDGCPADPTVTAACFPFTPANFSSASIDFSTTPVSTLNCGTTTVNTATTPATITNWCGTAPVPAVQTQTNGPSIVVIPLRGLTVSANNTLKLIGPLPVVFAVRGNVSIAGVVDASASGTTPGAGGNWSCGTSQGGNGTGDTSRLKGASGGGGGGFGTKGGKAGTANTDGSDRAGGIAGVARGASTLTPLYGGCAGGQGGDCSTVGGAGGGAVQIAASGTLTVTGSIRANGGAGATPCGSNDEGGGTGGGSGGAILLQAATLNAPANTLQANGGNGGKNGNYAGIFNCGGDNGGAGATNSGSNGGNGGNCQGGSPGGGGGYGRIRLN